MQSTAGWSGRCWQPWSSGTFWSQQAAQGAAKGQQGGALPAPKTPKQGAAVAQCGVYRAAKEQQGTMGHAKTAWQGPQQEAAVA